jgi:hypothetical protein
MNDSSGQLGLRRDLIASLRSQAGQGANVRQLVGSIVESLQLKEHKVIPVLWYLATAFCLPLPTVLPVREWLGTEDDKEIDAVILPEIEKSKSKWEGEERDGFAGDATKTSRAATS